MEETRAKGDAFWLLSDAGILDVEGEAHPDVPFQGTSADTGACRDGRAAILVDEHEVWIHAHGSWKRALRTEATMHSLAWTHEGRLLVGTEPARVAFVEDGALAYLKGFDAVPEQDLWSTPWGGPAAVRSLAVSPDNALYANVHVGWIVRSRDGGRTWQTLRTGLEKDVHQVAAHPRDPATVFAATADGFHLSRDHGDTFERRVAGLPHVYQRACACFPDRDVYLSSAATGSGGRRSGLYRSEDEGRFWARVAGLPEDLDRNINTGQVALRAGGEALVVVDDTTVYRSVDYGASWSRLRAGLPRVWSLLAF